MFIDPATSICPCDGRSRSLDDLRAPAVGADDVPGPDRVLGAGQPVPDQHGDAVVVLLHRHVLGVEADVGAALGGVADEDRLHEVLRDVADAARAGQRVVRLPARVRAPGADPAELVAGQRGAEHRVAHQVLRHGERRGLLLDAEVAEDLHRPLVGDVGPGRVGRPPVLGDDDVLDAVRGQRERGGRPGGAGADDEDVGGEHAHAGVPPGVLALVGWWSRARGRRRSGCGTRARRRRCGPAPRPAAARRSRGRASP